MRALALGLLLAAIPLAAADSEEDSSYGLNLGFVAPGMWDVFTFATGGGPVVLTLYWEEPLAFPFADYDLRLYRPGAMANNQLSDGELMAESSQHPYAHHGERLDVNLAANTYIVAVVPFQAQMETYTLTGTPGDVEWYAEAFGYVAYEP